jgi:molybdopterin-guanine dinucleotide biosynthesis protein A
MLDRVLTAVADATHRVVVGPPQPVPPEVALTRESPPGGGPVAALAAGLAVLAALERTSDQVAVPDPVAVLAADQALLTGTAVRVLRRALAGAADRAAGAVFVDGAGRAQWLCGVWRVAALRDRLVAVGDPDGVALRRLFDGLETVPVRWAGPAPPPWYDCDTADDVTTAENWLRTAP